MSFLCHENRVKETLDFKPPHFQAFSPPMKITKNGHKFKWNINIMSGFLINFIWAKLNWNCIKLVFNDELDIRDCLLNVTGDLK